MMEMGSVDERNAVVQNAAGDKLARQLRAAHIRLYAAAAVPGEGAGAEKATKKLARPTQVQRALLLQSPTPSHVEAASGEVRVEDDLFCRIEDNACEKG